MTVKELIEKLQEYDENLAVVRFVDESEDTTSVEMVEPYENDTVLVW